MNGLFAFASGSDQPSKPLHVHKIDGTVVDVDLVGVSSVTDVRRRVGLALGVDNKPQIGIKLLNGAVDVCNDTSLDSLDQDAGLCVVLVQGAPDWYPREKYTHDGLEVLQISGEQGGEYFAEFIDGSSEQVDIALYERALREWLWTQVQVGDRVWAHPREKPEESGGWTSFFASPTVRKRAVTGVGACAGFLAGVTGNMTDGPNDGSDFSTAFKVAQVIGIVSYGIIKIAQVVRK